MKINSFLLRCTLVAALGGFLFGFETAVISGAEKPFRNYGPFQGTESDLPLLPAFLAR